MTDPHPIVKELRRIRIDNKLSQVDLACDLDIGQNVLSFREMGRVSPQLNTLSEWASALGYELTLRPKLPKG
jgi:transcriptional regulator with XRE-family HTH domain